MFSPQKNDLQKAFGSADQTFKFWISFWPVAPFFGVEWRFAELARSAGMPTAVPGDGRLPVAKPRRAARKALGAQVRSAEEVTRASAMADPVDLDTKTPSPKEFEAAVERAMEPNAEGDRADGQTEKLEGRREGTAEKSRKTPDNGKPTAKADDDQVELISAGKPKGLMTEAPSNPDDLKLIKGVGPSLEKQLNGMGVYTFKQIAGFTDQDLAWVDANLTSFKGRCFRDDWVEQARQKLN